MKFFLQIFLILLIVATFSICAIQPEMHKNFMVYDSAYTPVAEQDVKTETKEIPVMEKNTAQTQTVQKVESVQQPVQQKVVSKAVVNKKAETASKQNTTVTKAVTKPQAQTTVKPVVVKTEKPVVKEVIQQEPKISEKKVVSNAVPVSQAVKQTTEQPKVMTQQEENIAWNIWRSNLTNKIMQDTKLPNIPNGTVFQFSFNVDKYGKITNVQTGANPANYTPYAIQYIAPVIRSYQGHSILNFPEGTARTSTQVTGKWRISTSEKYSTPQDYNDIERVKR